MSVFDAPAVQPAPEPSMSLAGAAPGELLQHHDFRGDIYRVPVSSFY